MHFIPPLLSVVLMQATAETPPATFAGSIGASVAGGPVFQDSTYHGGAAEGQAEVDWYVRRRLVDDATPFGLQPLPPSASSRACTAATVATLPRPQPASCSA